jgi:hypothetical protein
MVHGSGNLTSLFDFECQDGAKVSPLDRQPAPAELEF